MKDKRGAYVALNERMLLLKMLLRWKGSIWQKLYYDILTYLGFYILVSLLYRFVFAESPNSKRSFEGFVNYIQKIASIVPLTFLLGFFVSTVLRRWWSFVNTIPWMSKPAFYVQAYLNADKSEYAADIFQMRNTILRYLNLAWILQMTKLSHTIRTRFKWRSKGFHEEGGALTCCGCCPIGRQKSSQPRIRYDEMLCSINEDVTVKATFGQLITPDEVEVFRCRARAKGQSIGVSAKGRTESYYESNARG
ncbi:unnamed protein product [Protopolystoma xenopodis]|uniref:Bestrophin homolog n=1 Tax=Protopolystoma xenopodis TaxID=117903 RepID=A0A3S5B980_9PLAT|nr:unnamed protein product [Protopolystoma xenopodis]